MGETAKLALELTLAGASAVAGALRSTVDAVGGIGSALGRANESFFFLVNNAKTLGAAGAALGRSIVEPNIKYDSQREMVSFLLKSAPAAEAKLQELLRAANMSGFRTDEMVNLYVNLQRISRGALTSAKDMELWGRAAKLTGQDAGATGQLLGQVWAALESGADVGRVLRQLLNFGLISPQVASQLDKMGSSGAKAATMWGAIRSAIESSTGGVAGASETWTDITNELKNFWEEAKRLTGQGLFYALKSDLGDLRTDVQGLFESGRVQKWGENIGKEIEGFYEKLKKLPGGNIFDQLTAGADSGSLVKTLAIILETSAKNFGIGLYNAVGENLPKAIDRITKDHPILRWLAGVEKPITSANLNVIDGSMAASIAKHPFMPLPMVDLKAALEAAKAGAFTPGYVKPEPSAAAVVAAVAAMQPTYKAGDIARPELASDLRALVSELSAAREAAGGLAANLREAKEQAAVF